MDGDVRTCGRVDGWSHHEPPPAPGEALCCCQGSTAEKFLLFFFASHTKVQGGQRRYARAKAERWRASEEAEPVLDLRSAKSAAPAQRPRLAPAASLNWAATPSFAKTSLINQILSRLASAPPRLRAPEVLEAHNGDASMAPRAVDRLRLLHVLAPRPLPGLSQCLRAATFCRTSCCWKTLRPTALRRLAHRPCGFCSGAESVPRRSIVLKPFQNARA